MKEALGSPVTARACANIALVKYWGKRDAALNLPAEGSLSLTLAALSTTTIVRFDEHLATDSLRLDGQPATGRALGRLSAWLDLVRARAGIGARAEVVSDNDFPTASGLASSASAYAALALAATRAAGLVLDERELSVFARLGSGSAARSIHGGFVRMHRGRRADGSDAFAEPVAAADADWPVRMVIAVVGGGRPKQHASRDAMEHCAATSPLYAGWLASVPGDLTAAEDAIAACDLERLGPVAEASALCMHAAAMASRPAVLYLEPATLACMAAIRALRADSIPAYYTMDAGPHVKALCTAEYADRVRARLAEVPGVSRVMISKPGPGVEVLAPTS
jgi:diphosphomevalonate decarboxylase